MSETRGDSAPWVVARIELCFAAELALISRSDLIRGTPAHEDAR